MAYPSCPYYPYPYPSVGYPTHGPYHPTNIRPAGIGPKNEEKKPAYHLVEAANKMTENLRNLMNPMTDMICSHSEFSNDGMIFSGRLHEFKGRFDEANNNATKFMGSLKNPKIDMMLNPEPIIQEENYFENIDKDVKRQVYDFHPIPNYPCPSEIKCYIRPITPPLQNHQVRHQDRLRRRLPQQLNQTPPCSYASTYTSPRSTARTSSKSKTPTSSSIQNSSSSYSTWSQSNSNRS